MSTVDKSWVFNYYYNRGYDCTYPHTFNGKKVICFNEEHRPIGLNGIDLIEELREQIDNGERPLTVNRKKKRLTLFE